MVNNDSISEAEAENVINDVQTVAFRTDSLEDGPGSGWGYDIYVEGKLVIRQPHIPSISGLKPFASMEDAMSVATLVEYKIRNNIMPPAVTRNELDSLEITL